MNSPAYQRFLDSMPMNLERWRDGIGYDLEAIDGCTEDERASIETLLLSRPNDDWRDIEALAKLGSPRAIERLRRLAEEGPLAQALEVIARAPELVDAERSTACIARAFDDAPTPEVIARATDLAEYHPAPVVVGAILRRLVMSNGPTAYDLGALLLVMHGILSSRWDMDERPLLLGLTDSDPGRRAGAIEEIVRRCAAGPARSLG
jgi:hypothetical protein